MNVLIIAASYSLSPFSCFFSLSLSLTGTLAQRKHAPPHPISNLVDAIWTDQPPVPHAPVRVHPLRLAGVSVPEKLATVRKLVVKEGASSLVVMAMDEVYHQAARRLTASLFVYACAEGAFHLFRGSRQTKRKRTTRGWCLINRASEDRRFAESPGFLQ